MRLAFSLFLLIALVLAWVDRSPTHAQETSSSTVDSDPRLGELQNLNGYFPFRPVETSDQWNRRRDDIRRRILVSQGLWPQPSRSDLNAVVHGRVDREDYVVDRVFFESIPGHFVTGSLYRPKEQQGPFPVILSPHGHWKEGRFYDAGLEKVTKQVGQGAEEDLIGGRFPIQARAVQLARMGCLVFVYDMTGNADSIQLAHRPADWSHLDTPQDWGFMSVQADLRLQNMMGLQTWNSIRAIDFVLGLSDVDPSRIGVTGASGGGTQSMLLAAVDDRIAAAMPCVMVSTAMQGGCTCENAPLLRVGQGNIDIAAATAPRPLGLTAADDWTVELRTKGFPDLERLYRTLGQPDHLTAAFHTEFEHNYNLVNREVMYGFFNRHFGLGLEEPIVERPYRPLTIDEATVWSGPHAAPTGDHVGDRHEINLLKIATADSERQMERAASDQSVDHGGIRDVVGGGWSTIIGRNLAQVGDVEVLSAKSTGSASGVTRETLVRTDNGERVAIESRKPPGQTRALALMITDEGLASFRKDGTALAMVSRLADDGFEVVTSDLFGQGDDDFQSQPMWFQPRGDTGWKRFSGYTYGYNHCLFAKRVHDVLTIVRHLSDRGLPIDLIGIGKVAGPLAIAARSQCRDAVRRSVVGVDGFQFRDLTRHDDPMFVPGAVKYFGVDGLLALNAPASVLVLGDDSYPVAARAYSKLEAEPEMRKDPDASAGDVDRIARFLAN